MKAWTAEMLYKEYGTNEYDTAYLKAHQDAY